MSNDENKTNQTDTGTVSRPMGRLYASPVPATPVTVATVPKISSAAPMTEVMKLPGEMGANDGHISIKFDSNLGQNGSGYEKVSHSFEFDLPNIVGTLSIAQMNKDSIMQIFEEALIRKLGGGGVVRK